MLSGGWSQVTSLGPGRPALSALQHPVRRAAARRCGSAEQLLDAGPGARLSSRLSQHWRSLLGVTREEEIPQAQRLPEWFLPPQADSTQPPSWIDLHEVAKKRSLCDSSEASQQSDGQGLEDLWQTGGGESGSRLWCAPLADLEAFPTPEVLVRSEATCCW